MKIDRHLAILNILTEYDQVTAPFLAEKLEVSRRTINRDIEDLCKAGIPIVTTQGSGGGIALMAGYRIDKTILKEGDLSDLVAALKGISSIGKTDSADVLIKRLADKDCLSSDDEIMVIDLASHYRHSLSSKIDQLKKAITAGHVVRFDYYSAKGKSVRQVEPYKIMFRWSDWYLLGYSISDEDFRFFKLNRLWALAVTDQVYKKRQIKEQATDLGSHLTDHLSFEALFDKRVEYLVVEAYGPKSYETTPDGLHFYGSYTNIDFIAGWLMGFGNKVKVLSPPELVKHLKENSMKFE